MLVLVFTGGGGPTGSTGRGDRKLDVTVGTMKSSALHTGQHQKVLEMRDMYQTWPRSCQRSEGWVGQMTPAVFLLVLTRTHTHTQQSGAGVDVLVPCVTWLRGRQTLTSAGISGGQRWCLQVQAQHGPIGLIADHHTGNLRPLPVPGQTGRIPGHRC